MFDSTSTQSFHQWKPPVYDEMTRQDGHVGMNVENPKLFTYNGRWYELTIQISNWADASLKSESLDNQHIELFEYVNEVNTLCLTGKLVFRDIDGTISKFYNRNYNHITVTCSQKIKKQVGKGGKDGPIEIFEDIPRPDGANLFAHTFIVQNFGILERDPNAPQVITYEMELISINWYKAVSQIEYSNYDLPAESKEKNVFEMIRKFLTDAGLKTDKDSFDHAYDMTKSVKVDFITSGNDTLMSAIPYLFNRLYFIDKVGLLDRLFFMVYDVLKDEYRIVDYSDDKYWLNTSKGAIVLSLFETSFEQSLFSETNQLGSTKLKTQTDVFESMFNHKYYKYDREKGFFGGSDFVKTESIAKLRNAKAKIFDKADGPTIEKYQLDFLPEAFSVPDAYYNEMQDCNNDFRIYLNLIESFTARDALIVNSEGDITHQPGTAMGIVLDRTIEKVPEDIPTKDLEKLYEKHRQIENIFAVFKTRHMYKTATPASYTENIVLARNFLLTPKQVGGGSGIKEFISKAVNVVRGFVVGIVGK